jgi:hypothetical protein
MIRNNSGVTVDDWFNQYQVPSQTFPHNYTQVSVVVDSHSSPNYFIKKPMMIQYKPRFARPVTEPTLPFKKYARKPFITPKRPNQSNRSYQRLLRKYQAKLAVYESLSKRYELVYQTRLVKYKNRMLKYEAYLFKLKYGVERDVRVLNTSLRQSTWNPYSRVTTFYQPLNGFMRNDFAAYSYYYRQYKNCYDLNVGYLNDVDTRPLDWSPQSVSTAVANATSAADSKALSKLHNRLNEQTVHLGNIVAERAQTLNLIKSTLIELVKLVKMFSFRYAASRITNLFSVHKNKELANGVLAYYFGVAPLVSDIYGAVELLKKHDTIDTVTVTAKGSSVDNVVSVYKVQQDSDPSHDVTETLTCRVEVKVRYVLEYNVDNSALSELQKLGLINPAEILWEAMPWSFVIDWVLPIGNYIRYLSNGVGLSYIRGTKVTTTTTYKQLTRSVQWAPYNGYNQSLSSNATAIQAVETKTRVLLSAPPKLSVPSFKNPISFSHVIESLALLRQLRS